MRTIFESRIVLQSGAWIVRSWQATPAWSEKDWLDRLTRLYKGSRIEPANDLIGKIRGASNARVYRIFSPAGEILIASMTI